MWYNLETKPSLIYEPGPYLQIYQNETFFFESKHSQTHVDSVNQGGNSASMCTKKDGCFQALRAMRSPLCFSS